MSDKEKRGFAALSPERKREIASKGGRAAHAKGTAHQWSREEAREAGHKGGVAVSRDREHMSAIGREGGEARGRASAARRARRFLEREAPRSAEFEGAADTMVPVDGIPARERDSAQSDEIGTSRSQG